MSKQLTPTPHYSKPHHNFQYNMQVCKVQMNIILHWACLEYNSNMQWMNTQLNFNQFVSGGCDFLFNLKLCKKYHVFEQADTLINSAMTDKLSREQITCFVNFQASTVVQKRLSLFCAVTQRLSVVVS